MIFNETSIPANYSMDIRNKARMDIMPEDVEAVYDVFIASFSDFLANVKSKEKAVALVMEDLKGNFKFAGIVTYHENENKDMPGNWTYELSFNEEDIKDITTIYKTLDTKFEIVVADTAHRVRKMRFASPTHIHDIFICCVDTLIKYLDENAVEGETKEVDLPSYFVASVSVVDGKKEMSIIPGDAMKRIIKDDSAL